MSTPDPVRAGRAYKILTKGQWAGWQAARDFAGAPADVEDGFIHLSAADQVAATHEKWFAGLHELMLVEVDLDRLGDAVRWEPSRGGALFPHVYGTIPIDAVTAARPIDD